MSKILSNDRFVACFGAVPAGDTTLLPRIAVGAVRAGFGVVPCQEATDAPACALGVRDAKKPHDCYHVLTEDNKTRAAFNRLTKDDATCNLAVDLEASGIAVAEDASFWTGPEISPTMELPDGRVMYVFELDGYVPELPGLITKGHILVPPSSLYGGPLHLVGQTNLLKEEYVKATNESVWNAPEANATRLEDLEFQITELRGDMEAVKKAVKVALRALQELKAAQ